VANDLAGEALASETAKNPMKGEGSTRSSRRVRGRLASASRLTTLDHFLRFVNGSRELGASSGICRRFVFSSGVQLGKSPARCASERPRSCANSCCARKSESGSGSERSDKPGSVPPREGRRRPFLWDRSCLRPRTTYPEGVSAGHRPLTLPIWSFSAWGLPCQSCHQELRCALTAPFQPCRPHRSAGLAVYSLLHFPWPHGRLPLATTLTRGARTFLPPISLGSVACASRS